MWCVYLKHTHTVYASMQTQGYMHLPGTVGIPDKCNLAGGIRSSLSAKWEKFKNPVFAGVFFAFFLIKEDLG